MNPWNYLRDRACRAVLEGIQKALTIATTPTDDEPPMIVLAIPEEAESGRKPAKRER